MDNELIPTEETETSEQLKPTDIPLRYPVRHDGQKFTALRMRPPYLKDMIAGQVGGGGDAMIEVRSFAHLCEVSPDTLMELHMYDYERVKKAYRDFLS